MTRLKLYHASHSRSFRVAWALEEMGLAYELCPVKLAIGNTGGKEYKKINPWQKVPALDVNGKILLESTAILEYLAMKHNDEKLTIDPDHEDYGLYLQWLHGGEGGLGMYLSLYAGHTFLLPKEQRDAGMAAWAQSHLKTGMALFGTDLAENDFIAGNTFTIADISVGYLPHVYSMLGSLDDILPKNAQNWFKKLQARPAFQKAASL